jgi:hypothetical protein
MRYMMLIYSQETESATPDELQEVAAAHRAVMDETNRRGIFRAADPLEPTSTATTVRVQDGKVLMTDGPFAETKEQLAGYYILDCQDLDEALEWAAKIPTDCRGSAGYVEVRPIREIGKPNAVHG